MRARLANVRSEICALIQRYGNWGCSVATASGKVLHAAQYALAAKAIGSEVRVYRIADSDEDVAREMLGRTYGVFSYAHLQKKTYI
jgi:ParB family chromosome partitioning protein